MSKSSILCLILRSILFVLNRGWRRDSLQLMILVNVCSTWSMVELKTRFEAWVSRNDVNAVSLLHLSYLIILMAYLCSQWTPNDQINYFMFDWSINRIFVLNRGWKPDTLLIMIFVNVSSTWSIVELKTPFETWITRNDVNGVRLFHHSHIITTTAYKCSQWTPNVQMKYFMFHWTIDRLFVLIRAWKRDSLQVMIFVYVSSTWGIVELKTLLETWITRNYVYGVSLFHQSY
jgi:hypothetical protein